MCSVELAVISMPAVSVCLLCECVLLCFRLHVVYALVCTCTKHALCVCVWTIWARWVPPLIKTSVALVWHIDRGSLSPSQGTMPRLTQNMDLTCHTTLSSLYLPSLVGRCFFFTFLILSGCQRVKNWLTFVNKVKRKNPQKVIGNAIKPVRLKNTWKKHCECEQTDTTLRAKIHFLSFSCNSDVTIV